jgi:hypothetical protein
LITPQNLAWCNSIIFYPYEFVLLIWVVYDISGMGWLPVKQYIGWLPEWAPGWFVFDLFLVTMGVAEARRAP